MKVTTPNRSAAVKTTPRSVLRTAPPVPEAQIDPAIGRQRVTAHPGMRDPSPRQMQALQHTVGNRAVSNLLNRRMIQRKQLSAGEAGDQAHAAYVVNPNNRGAVTNDWVPTAEKDGSIALWKARTEAGKQFR